MKFVVDKRRKKDYYSLTFDAVDLKKLKDENSNFRKNSKNTQYR